MVEYHLKSTGKFLYSKILNDAGIKTISDINEETQIDLLVGNDFALRLNGEVLSLLIIKLFKLYQMNGRFC